VIGMPPHTLFGVPLLIKRVDAQQLIEALSGLWVWQMGRPPGVLDDDLDALRRFFDPLATGKRLRGLLGQLTSAPPVRARLLAAPLVLGEADGRLITLEGRAALELLRRLLAETCDDSIGIDSDTVYAVEHLVYERYRQWSLRRIEDVFALRSGRAEALRLPSIGLLLLLLVNGSRSSATALRPLPDAGRKARLDAGVSTIVARFCDALDQRERDSRHFVLYSGYPLTEARRRLPGVLHAEPNGIYIPPTGKDRVLTLVASELRRPQRSFPTRAVLAAFDQLVAAYRQELPVLAALDVAFEQRAETRHLRERLEALLGNDDASA
jgi:hypothetical protein